MKSLKSMLGIGACAVLFCVLALSTIGCNEQQTASELLDTAGTAISALLVYEGNTAVAAQVQKDFAADSNQVASWTKGSPTGDVAEALNDVEDDLNLLPISPQEQALADLAIGTVDQVLAFFPAGAPSPAATPSSATSGPTTLTAWQVAPKPRTHVFHRKVHLAKTPKNAKEFKAQWNATAAALGRPTLK